MRATFPSREHAQNTSISLLLNLRDLLVLVQSLVEQLVLVLRLALVNALVTKTSLGVGSGVWVQTQQHLLVPQRVLLLHVGALGDVATADGAEHALHLRAVDQLGDVRLRDGVLREHVVLLELGRLGGGAVDAVERVESGGGPDDEATEVATRGELEQVERVDWASLDTRDVAGGRHDLLAILLRLVDDERAAALSVASAPQLTLAGANLLGELDLLEILASANGLEEVDSSRGLLHGSAGECGRRDDERDLRHSAHTVAAGHQESSRGRCGDGRSSSEALLAKVDLLVPFPPDLGRSEHAARTALVTEGGLTSTVGTTTRDTGDTGDSTASTPGLSGSLVTSLLAHGVWLPLVLRHAGVHRLHDVRADRRLEDVRQRGAVLGGGAIGTVDGDGRARHG